MTPKKRRRLYFATAIILASAGGAWLILYALGQNKIYFQSPSDIAANHVPIGTTITLGGLVAQKSISHGAGAEVRFAVTDLRGTVPVVYRGVLPALFREGQGVVLTGALDANGTVEASLVFAKHDEKYMPPEVVDELKRSGHWQEDGAP
jgi:cytochrome c-type biogenesis protein CcmE